MGYLNISNASIYRLPQTIGEGQYQIKTARINKSQAHKIQGIPVAILVFKFIEKCKD
jgi:hypothetical protein